MRRSEVSETQLAMIHVMAIQQEVAMHGSHSQDETNILSDLLVELIQRRISPAVARRKAGEVRKRVIGL